MTGIIGNIKDHLSASQISNNFCQGSDAYIRLLIGYIIYNKQNYRMWFKDGLKAQKLLAQGIALGIMAISKAPCKGKSFVYCPVF